MSDPDERWQGQVQRALSKIHHQNWRLVAMVVNKKKPISIATNNPNKSHPDITLYDCHRMAHAEPLAIQRARKNNISGADLYIWRWGHDERWRLAKPCKLCMRVIENSGIKRVFYTTNEGKMEMMLV